MFKKLKKIIAFINIVCLLSIFTPVAIAAESAVINLTVTLNEAFTFPGPTGLTALNSSESIDLSWDTHSNPEVVGYHIYRSTTQGGPYSQIASYIGQTSYQDTDVVSGTTYYYRVSAVDFEDIESAYSDEVSARKLALLLQFSASPNPFSPDNDAADEITEITYETGAEAHILLEIIKTDESSVKLLKNVSSETPGIYTVSWDGTDDTGIVVSDDTYRARICITLLDGFQEMRQIDIIVSTGAASVEIINVSDFPDAFTPNSNGENDEVHIDYGITSDALVSVKIYDKNSTLIKTLKDNVPETAGPNMAIWEGYTDDSVLAEDGVYTYEITADTASVQGTVNLDTTFLTVIAPDPLQGIGGNVTLTFESTGLISVDTFMLEYKNDSGVWEGLGALPQQVSDTLWTIGWDMSNLEAGDYSLACFVMFDSDKAEYTKWTQFSVQNPSDITDAFTTNGMITPNADMQHDSTEIIYSIINAPADITVSILDENLSTIKTIKNNVYEERGTFSAVWDGTDDLSSPVGDGTYTYQINADDGQGNIVQKQGVINVVNDPFTMISPASGSTIADWQITLNARVSASINDVLGVYMQASNSDSKWYEDIGYAQNYIANEWEKDWDTSSLSPGTFNLWVEVLYFDSLFEVCSETYAVNYTLSNDNFIINAGESKDPFSPNENALHDTTDISYELLKEADVTIEIFDADSLLVRTLKSSEFEVMGEYALTWDGKGESSIILGDGVYTYTISCLAMDESTSEVSGTVTIDSKLIELISPAENSTLSSAVDIIVKPTVSFSNVSAVYLNCDSIGYAKALTLNADSTWSISFDPQYYASADYDFYFKLEFTDNNGESRYDLTRVYDYFINNGDLSISNLQMIPNPFSPDQSGTWIDLDTGIVYQNPAEGLTLDDETTIIFDSDTIGYFTINLKDQDANVIETIYNGLLTPNDEGKIEYLYKGLNITDNGDYIIEVIANDNLQTLSRPLTVDKRPELTNIRAAPNPFTVLEGDLIEFSFTTSQDSYIDILIYDKETEALVKTLWQNQSVTKGIAQAAYWDGLDDSHNPVAQGNYKAVIYARSTLGNAADPIELIITASGVSNVARSTDNINPYLEETVDISFDCFVDALVNVKIYNASGALVRNLLSNYTVLSGESVNVSWDGKDDSSSILDDGLYYFRIEDAVSSSEVYTGIDTGNYAYNGECLFITTPYQTGSTYFTKLDYTLSRSGYITLRVRDDYYEGPELRFIKTEEPMPVGNHVSYWDGRDESGNLLAYGDYLIALWAYTFEDNAILIKGGRPIIENFGITNVRVRPDGSNPYIIGTDYEQANIYFTVSQDANVTINIYNSSAVRAKTLLSDSFLSQGVVHNITWDGLDDSNSRLCEGGYRAVVQARVGQNYSEPVILQIDLDF